MYLIAKILMNSLYGRFGLNPYLNSHTFIKKDEYDSFMNNHRGKLTEISDFGTHKLVSIINEFHENDRGIAANVAVAIAITSNSRGIMNVIKNSNDFNLYYTDTDSGIIDSELPTELVDSKKLGKWKLEGEYLYFVSLGPKMYGAIDIFGNAYTKVKGFKNAVDIEVLDNLLNKDYGKEKLSQNKWFKKITMSEITERNSVFSLRPTDNKRVLIYDNNILTSTKPIKLFNGEKVNN